MLHYLMQAKLSTAQRPEQIVTIKTPLNSLSGQQALLQALDLLNKDYGADAKLYALSLTQIKR